MRPWGRRRSAAVDGRAAGRNGEGSARIGGGGVVRDGNGEESMCVFFFDPAAVPVPVKGELRGAAREWGNNVASGFVAIILSMR
jgi:hypothetical protein